MSVVRFQKDHWYKCNIPIGTSTPCGWNEKMKDVFGGAPLHCIYSEDAYAEFEGHQHFDGLSDKKILKLEGYVRGWKWDVDPEYNLGRWWDEVPGPHLVIHPDFTALHNPSVSISPGCISYMKPYDEDDSDKSFKFPKRSDLRAELLRKLLS